MRTQKKVNNQFVGMSMDLNSINKPTLDVYNTTRKQDIIDMINQA